MMPGLLQGQESESGESPVRMNSLPTRAAERAVLQAGATAKDVDLTLVTTCTPDMQFPSSACLIQHKLGAVHAWF